MKSLPARLGLLAVLFTAVAAGKADLLATRKPYVADLRASVDLPAWKAWTGESKRNASNIEHVCKELNR